jgi:hypothetical protein
VSDSFLKQAGVRRITASEAQHLCGIAAGGLWLPYQTIGGKPVERECDGPQAFGRLRLNVPTDDRKYHQRAGTKPYGYLPPNLHALTAATDLVVVEGEFKALALAEAGIPAVGVGGINLAFTEGQLVPGLREAVQSIALKRILFLGDGDTSLIFAFSREAVRLTKDLPNLAIVCPRIGLDGPDKGIDDCRAKLGTEFLPYWTKLVAEAEPVSADDTAEQLALRLLKRESHSALKQVSGVAA